MFTRRRNSRESRSIAFVVRRLFAGEEFAAAQLPSYGHAGARAVAKPSEPLFLVRFKTSAGDWQVHRIDDHRVWKIVNDLGRRAGIPGLHPHAFRHSCGVELLRRTAGNLRAVQEHLRHADIQTTTVYTRLSQQDLQRVVSVFDRRGD